MNIIQAEGISAEGIRVEGILAEGILAEGIQEEGIQAEGIQAEGDLSEHRNRKSSPAVQLLSGRKEFFQVRAHELWRGFSPFQASCPENQSFGLSA